MRRAHDAGIAVVLTIAHTPIWAGGTAKHNHAPKKGSDLQNFAYAAATRYSGHFKGADGTVLPQVTRWEAWNEPNTNTHLSPQYVCINGKGFWCRGGHFNLVSPTAYAGILNAIYTGVHKAGTKYHVKEQVAGGATKPGGDGPTAAEPSVNPITFVNALAKRHPKLDAYSHHPYRVPGAKCQTCGGLVTIDNLSKLTTALDKGWPGRRLHLWLTEYGAQTKPPDPLGVTHRRAGHDAAPRGAGHAQEPARRHADLVPDPGPEVGRLAGQRLAERARVRERQQEAGLERVLEPRRVPVRRTRSRGEEPPGSSPSSFRAVLRRLCATTPAATLPITPSRVELRRLAELLDAPASAARARPAAAPGGRPGWPRRARP